MDRWTGNCFTWVYEKIPKSRPSAHTTSPDSRIWCPVNPRKSPWSSSGRRRFTSPPGRCSGSAGACASAAAPPASRAPPAPVAAESPPGVWAAAPATSTRPIRAATSVLILTRLLLDGFGARDRRTPAPDRPRGVSPEAVSLLVVFDAEVGDLLLTHQPAQRVLELGLLNEQVVLRVQPLRRLRALEVERQPLLDAPHPGALRQVEEQR